MAGGITGRTPSGKPGVISKLWTIIARSLTPFSGCWEHIGLSESYGGHSAKTGNSQAIDLFPVFFMSFFDLCTLGPASPGIDSNKLYYNLPQPIHPHDPGNAADLFEQGFIDEDQYNRIELITSGKLLSVFYELRSLLYLGVLMFTTGVGLLIYENIGELGHILSIILLIILCFLCFAFVFKWGAPYSKGPVSGPTPYFDYVLLLGALLFISVLGYLQFQFGFLDENLGNVTLVTACFFFFIAYRFDHLGVLSLAITALASFWSITISPQKWYHGDFFSSSHLHITALIFGASVASLALVLDNRSIKKHFTFTYLNFCSLIFFAGAITGLFMGENYSIYLLLIYFCCAFAYFVARWKRSFLFLLYAFLAAYIGTTYFLAVTIFRDAIELWFFYSILSCGGFVFFIIYYKNHFRRQA